jgi:hypothetical protein
MPSEHRTWTSHKTSNEVLQVSGALTVRHRCSRSSSEKEGRIESRVGLCSLDNRP